LFVKKVRFFKKIQSWIFLKKRTLKSYEFSWLNKVFDTCVSFTFFSKTLDLTVAKNGSKEVNNTNFGFLMVKLTYVPLQWQHE